MKLLRFGPAGAERPGLVHDDGSVRDLSAHVRDFTPEVLAPEALDALRTLDHDRLPVVESVGRIGPCVPAVGHFLAVGLNFRDHARETGANLPRAPILFSKAPSCLSGPDDPIIIPAGAKKLDWEVELAFVVGRTGRRIARNDALGYLAGFCICNDVSERAWQLQTDGGQWLGGKSAPSFGPLGPWLVTPDSVPDSANLSMFLEVNGVRMQEGTTADMIFDVPAIVEFISHRMDLVAGDVVTTGTPAGVGMGRVPPRFLRVGDEVRVGIDGLGLQTQAVAQGA